MDVAFLQSIPENNGAMFQVASNFNGVEAIDECSYPDNEKFLTNYSIDNTQGPAASMSAGAAAISRVLLPFYSKDTPADMWKQTSDRQVEFLEELEDYFTVINGYIVQRGTERDPENDWDIVGHTHVGIQIGAQVINGHITRKGRDEVFMDGIPANSGQYVSQVFCAAMNLMQGDTGEENCMHLTAKRVDKLLLEAAYRGTYLAAIRHGAPRLFLTLIGGGVFGNSEKDIFEAIEKVHIDTACTEKNTTLEEVRVILFDCTERMREFLNSLKSKGVEVEIHCYKKCEKSIYTEF